jgi:hypothetical protein
MNERRAAHARRLRLGYVRDMVVTILLEALTGSLIRARSVRAER